MKDIQYRFLPWLLCGWFGCCGFLVRHTGFAFRVPYYLFFRSTAYLDSLIDLGCHFKQEVFGEECLSIVLDPDRFPLNFACLEEFHEMLFRSWLTVWSEYVEAQFVPPYMTVSLLILSQRLLRFLLTAMHCRKSTLNHRPLK